jgi:hypothetical protein
MTPEMRSKAQSGAEAMGTNNVEFREGYADELPLPGNFADVIINQKHTPNSLMTTLPVVLFHLHLIYTYPGSLS